MRRVAVLPLFCNSFSVCVLASLLARGWPEGGDTASSSIHPVIDPDVLWVIARQRGRKVDLSRVRHDGKDHTDKLEQTSIKCVFLFVSIRDAQCWAGTSSHNRALTIAGYHLLQCEWRSIRPVEKLKETLRASEWNLWVRHRGRCTVVYDESGRQQTVWSGRLRAIAIIRARRLQLRYTWQDIWTLDPSPREYLWDDFELQ